MMRRGLGVVLLAWIALSATACSPADFRPYAVRAPAAEQPTEPGNRLVVQAMDGNIFTINPDGSGRVNLTEDATTIRQYRQPAWSPDATRVAAARVDQSGGRTTGALVTFAHDGSKRTELLLNFPPFYLNWSPQGSAIAFLSNWVGLEGPNMALRLADVEHSSVDTIAEGSPYYFSWAPDGSRLVAHLSSLRVELQGIDGERTALSSSTAGYGAPEWAQDGDRLVFAVESAGRQSIVLSDLGGTPLAEITDFEERANFSLSPDGTQIAYVLTPAAAAVNSLGPLYVADVETRATRQLTSDPVWAYFWSPDSRKIAYLATAESRDRLWLRWFVWDGERVTAYDRYLPTRTFLQEYLAFSDQYARSMSIWSPGSDAFAYAGLVQEADARRGVWVQKLGRPAAEWVSGGVVVAWSPK